MLAPVTSDPAAGAGATPAVVAVGAFPESPDVVDGVWVEHPATATAITTSMIAMILIPEIFKLLPPDMMKIPDKSPVMRESGCRD
jgi:hypothetical protein